MNQRINRRQRYQINKLLLVTGLILAAIILIFVMDVMFDTSSIQGDVDISNKCYISIDVHTNDTLWSIADEHMNRDFYTYKSFIKEVTLMNDLSNNTIYAGEQILIPVIKPTYASRP